MSNPLLREWNTPFATPPFGTFGIEHFKPAIETCIKTASQEIITISENPDPPDFENTIAALDRTGEKLDDITSILFNLNSAETSKELQAVAQEVSPLLTRFSNDITLNKKLFSRIKAVYDSKENSIPDSEQKMLLEKSYRNFLLGGAGLEGERKERFREISEELSKLTIKFEENVLNDTNLFELQITNEEDLAGLPEGVKEMGAMEAKSRNKEGWVFTLHFPSYVAFMKY